MQGVSGLRLGIDASNLRHGGGLTHLVELLRVANPAMYGIEQIVVWGGQKTLIQLTKKSWLTLATDPLIERQLISRVFWQMFKLPNIARQNCDVLFVPGGVYFGNFHPYIIMSQNMLPFMRTEYYRYGASWMFLKLNLLRFLQTASIREADGTIFLTESARKLVLRYVKTLKGANVIIPHGVSEIFRLPPPPSRPIAGNSQSSPFRLLYISQVHPYKHQWNVVKAVHELRRAGFWVECDLVGSAYPPTLQRLKKVIRQLDPDEEYIHYHGVIPYLELPDWYHRADGFVFASSCECLPNSLLEAMAAGLPIACSNREPMPGLLGDAGLYFDPEQQESIVEALARLIQDNTWRNEHAQIAYSRAQDYSWEICARETLSFITQIAKLYR